MKGRDRGHANTIIYCSFLYGDKFKMTRTCPLKNRNHREFSIESLQTQKTPA